MDFLEKLKAFLVPIIAFFRTCSKLVILQSQPPPPSADDPETLQPESQPPSTNDPETLQPQAPPPPSSTFHIEMFQPPSPRDQLDSSPPRTLTTTPSNLEQLESILAAQQHLQWKNSVLTFCFQYALAVSLQYAQTDDHQANQPNSSFFLLSFLVLVTFNLILVALFISPSCTKTSEVLEKVAFLVASAAFCQATAIPFRFEFKCVVLAETLQPHAPPPPSSMFQPPSRRDQLDASHPRTPTTPFNLEQLESILAAQQHQQWKNSVLTFCFQYALAVSLQYAQTDDHQANKPNSSFVLLSFLVLVTFNLILVALFISPSCTKTSEVLEKVAFLVASAAFCQATAIPFRFEFKCVVLAVFLLSLLLITIFKYLNRNIA
ncbi:hypothetical protein REPUB_Repub05bG0156700 [Reevesia pubescens]